eukprot:19029-Heterococcus_DN1.PRE.2
MLPALAVLGIAAAVAVAVMPAAVVQRQRAVRSTDRHTELTALLAVTSGSSYMQFQLHRE